MIWLNLNQTKLIELSKYKPGYSFKIPEKTWFFSMALTKKIETNSPLK